MIALVSDVHCNESVLKVAKLSKVIVSSGDWDFCPSDFFRKVSEAFDAVYTIHGNNDDIDKLEKYFYLIRDGEVVNVRGIKVGGVNGIISPKGTPNKKGVPRKKPEEFLKWALAIKGKVDLYLTHEVPFLPSFFGRIWKNEATLSALRALVEVRPKVALIGHLHAFKCKIGNYGETRLVHVDTSVGGFALLRDIKEIECGEGVEPGSGGPEPRILGR
ncbi:hypothetical protein EYM_05320 [Ignicoccus islandicus DSM 13165]|uniref:Calcineurin-like phosphoesterase domain-containing protein n=1 Tax=Ignicoccus islandicus DSM 13165 TaxID=940295 RepID=A0A0U3FQH2_9CREN|nr:metallophosphoesterase family protein [Ignicoccus islandicus]ALU12575.1 hypothetical protein EYM_05320 [Ignicoccus islandicus DSM 13165]